VLSIGKMVARSGEYYIATVANGREEYYTGLGESPGFWLGEGSRRLGLEGSVNPDDLRQVLAGVSPGGEVLTAGRVDEAKRVAGFDLTWSAPKSVSLLFGLSDPAVAAVVRGVHEDSVDQALGYLERHSLSLRRGAGGQSSVSAEGLVAAAFTHRTSRAGDPQLHTHVLVANAIAWTTRVHREAVENHAPPGCISSMRRSNAAIPELDSLHADHGSQQPGASSCTT